MRRLSQAEMGFVSGGSRIKRPVTVNVDIDGDGVFDTTGVVENGTLTTADGTEYKSYIWMPSPDYQWGAFWANDAGDWRSTDQGALAYDLWMAQSQEQTAETIQDAITFTEILTDFLDPRTWLDIIAGDAAEQAEEDQDRIENQLEELQEQAPNP